MWPMTRTVQDTMSVPHTHDHPLSVLAKNKAMNQAVTACSESIIKVTAVIASQEMRRLVGKILPLPGISFSRCGR